MCQSLAYFQIGFTQLGNDQVHCVTFLRHSESPFRAVLPSKILSLTMVQFYGGGQFRDEFAILLKQTLLFYARLKISSRCNLVDLQTNLNVES